MRNSIYVKYSYLKDVSFFLLIFYLVGYYLVYYKSGVQNTVSSSFQDLFNTLENS